MKVSEGQPGTARLLAYMATPGGLTGAPRRLLTLANVLRDNNVDICVASEGNSKLLEAIAAEGHATAVVDTKGVLTLRHGALFGNGLLFRVRVLLAVLLQNARIWSRVRQYRADVIWLRGSKGIAFAGLAALFSRRPLVWDVDYELPSQGTVRWLHYFGLKVARAVVFQYCGAGERIFGLKWAERYHSKFHSITPGIDLSTLKPYMLRYRDKKPRGKRPFRILQVGTICDRKNQCFLLEVVGIFCRYSDRYNVQVEMAGGVFEEVYAREVSKEIEQAGLDEKVALLGWRDDVHELMLEADLLVMPSKDEGTPNTVQEAMAIGLPVIVSDQGGMPEIVSHGETGWVLPLSDPNVWAKQIEKCYCNPELCRKTGRAAAAYAGEHFGTQTWGEHYTQLVRSLVVDRP